MLALQTHLKETYSPQFSVPLFSTGKSFDSTLAPPDYSLPLHSFVSVVDGEQGDRSERNDPSDRSTNPNPSERSDGREQCERGEEREPSGEAGRGNGGEASDGVRVAECGKDCVAEQELNKQRLLHSDKKLFECTEPGCDLKFQTSSGLYKHRKKHQGGGETFICPEEGCGMRYQTKYVLMDRGNDV